MAGVAGVAGVAGLKANFFLDLKQRQVVSQGVVRATKSSGRAFFSTVQSFPREITDIVMCLCGTVVVWWCGGVMLCCPGTWHWWLVAQQAWVGGSRRARAARTRGAISR